MLMVLPLVALAGLALVGGLINTPFSTRFEFLAKWLESGLIPGTEIHAFAGEPHLVAGSTKIILAAIAVACGLAGIGLGWKIWNRGADQPELEVPLLKRAYGVDELVNVVIVKPGRALSDFAAVVFDRKIIDGLVNGLGTVVQAVGGTVRKVQTGYVRQYALGLVGGLVLMVGYVLVRTAL